MIKAILLDIEGTTTPIDFVHKTLFPFADERVSDFVAANFDQLDDLIVALRSEHLHERDPADIFPGEAPEKVAAYLKYLIKIDRKSTPLKGVQGEIWKQGYEAGLLTSEVFDDVPRAFERWREEGRTIAIYSSGSVLAQQLLFRHTEYGDLTGLISQYFDTNIGGKRETASYKSICKSLELSPSAVVFVSDIPDELDAARDAGLTTALSVRPGNTFVENADIWNVVTSFDEIE